MDLDLTPTPNSSQTKSSNDTDESNDTLPQYTSHHHHSLSFSKYHHTPPQNVAVVYKECMKNHAAAIGGHAVDGCGEFMPPPTPANSATSLKCAACGCHRNFHRRESSSPTGVAAITPPPFIDFRRPGTVKRFSLSPSPPPPQQDKVLALPKFAPGQMMFTLSTAAQEEHHQAPMTPTAEQTTTYTTGHGGRKRFRTKFTQEQKEKMLIFAEKIGWKIQKSDEEKVRDFCNEIGISRGVLKVWMHNNKNTIAKNSSTLNTNKDVTLIMNGDDSNIDNNGSGNKNNMGFAHHHLLSNGKSEGDI